MQLYAIEQYSVNSGNISKLRSNIDEGSLVVLFNDEENLVSKNDNRIDKFLQKANEKNSSIYSIAINKNSRKPTDIISNKQSYDVWEQLRCRNLGVDYLLVVAKILSIKIISKVMLTIYSNEGLVFVSHRRLDGEEITAKLCDRMKVQFKDPSVFRDVFNVEVGEETQDVIDY